MKNAELLKVTRWALLAACLVSPWAHATEPGTEPRQAPAETAPSRTKDLSSSDSKAGGGGAQPATTQHNQRPLPLHSQRPLPGTHILRPKPPVVAAARSYLLRKPQPAQLVRRAPSAVSGSRGMSAATLSPNPSRPASGVYGTSSRSSTSLKPLGGNGVIGGPHAPGGGMIGGPGNSRSVVKASIDGAAFHHRS
jgi:hypothetical protein